MTHFFYKGAPGLVKLASARSQDWIGVDMDGTLAEYHGFKGPAVIGAPVPAMVKRVKAWLDKGEKVKIFTARANMPAAVTAIKAWCKEHLGRELAVTNVKDHKMRELWDDRAHRVEKNTGVKLAEPDDGSRQRWQQVPIDANKRIQQLLDEGYIRSGVKLVRDPANGDPQLSARVRTKLTKAQQDRFWQALHRAHLRYPEYRESLKLDPGSNVGNAEDRKPSEWAAVTDGRGVQGTVSYRGDRDGVVIPGLYVNPGSRGKGIATELLRHVLAVAGKRNVTVNASASNVDAQRLYEARGFKPMTQYMMLPVDKQAQTAPNNEDEESNMGYGAHLGANFRAAGRALTKHPKGTPVTHILSDTAEHVLHGLIPLIKWEHQQPSMPFPEEELDAYRRRLAAGPAYTTRVSAERGRYKEGDEVTSPLGALRITQVQRFKAGTRHPFADELTPAQLQQIQGPYDLIKFETVKQAQAVTPGLGIPDMAVYGDVLGTLKPGDITDWVLQRHDTVRNPKNPHYDMRLGTKDTNLFSWAVPGATLPAPGQIKRPLPQTQLHTYQYGSFEGKIDCVVAGTLITCADGPHPIEKLQPDRDEVHVLGLGSRGLTFYRVQRLYRNVTRHQWLRLCVQAVNGELHTLVCGPEHGLYRLGQGFIRAKDITVGHTVALHHGTEPLFQHIMAAGADQYEISRVMGGADDPGHQMVHAQILGRPATTADTVTCSHNAYRTLPVLPVHRPCVIDGAPTHCARPAQSLYSMALKRFLDTLSANVQRVRDLCLTKTFVKVHSAQGCSVAECWRRTVTQYLCCAFARCTEILHNQCAQLFMLVRRSAGVQAFTCDYAAIDAQPVRDLCEGQSGPQQRQNLSFVERTAPTHLSPQLSDTNGISWGTIVQVESVTESQEAFDLLVDDAHNYFAQGLLVHNSGYGKGTVKMQDKGQAIITKVTPNTLHFTLGHQKVPMRYVLIHTGGKDGKMWQLLAKAQPSKIPGVGDKPIYKQIQAVDKDDAIAQAQALQEKIDGAHGIVNVNAKGDVDVYSVRPSVTGTPIAHTERMGVFGVRVPALRNTALRGELYYTDAKGKAVPFNDVSGLLNMLPSRSLQAQRERGLKPRIALFDVLTGETPGTIEDRSRRIREALKLLPPDIFHAPAEARTLSEKRRLFRTIAEGKDPRTSEGVMAIMPDGSVRKIKNKEEATGTLTGTYPGRGKRKGSAGGLTFKLDGAKTEGRVGTGFSDAQLADIVARIQELKGSPMRLEHMGQFGTGKLRAPSFKGFETDKAAAVRPQHVQKLVFGGDSAALSRMGKVSTPAKRLAAQISAYLKGVDRSKAMKGITKADVTAHLKHPDLQHVMSYKDAQAVIPRMVDRITNVPVMAKASAAAAESVRLQFKAKDGTIKASATVEIADTPGLRAKGLSKRAQLAPDHGMFFDKAGTYWMKDVAFPLDIVFVDSAGTVLGKTAMAVEADPSLPTRHYGAPSKAAHAIELPLGWCDRNGVGVGDVVTTN